MASPVPEPEGAPMHDEALAAFQARLLTSFYASSASDEIMAALRGAPECQPFSSYLDTFDHVGDDGATRSALQTDRDDGTVGSTTDRPVDPDEPGRTPEARPGQPSPPCLAGERAGGF